MPLPKAKAMVDRMVTQVGKLPLNELLPALLGEIAAALEVERVGYSRIVEDGTAIQQDIQYLHSVQRCDGKLYRLTAKEYPGYFAALQEPTNLIISHDVMTDPRLIEFQAVYFKTLGITSMLDVPVHRSGKLFGVICHEHVGPRRRWTDEEVDLARTLGHFVALAVETDERKTAEEGLRRALEREKELVQLKTNFVSLVSHEFRTPLGIIVSSADILESYFERLAPDQRAGHLQDIRHSARHMSNLMEEVLLLGKVESGRMVCRSEPLDLPDFCRRIVDEQLSATNHKCPIEFKSSGMDHLAKGDESLLRHVFGNLISNAVKYSPDGRAVRFSVRRDDAFAEFEIEDRGIGIDPIDQPHLFVAFHRGRNVGSSPGTGLGLVIVKRCVELHDGELRFQSQPGEGTRFFVRLKMFPPAPNGKPPKPAPKRGRKKS